MISLDCVSLGDSIATYAGLGGALHCAEVRAVSGVPSSYVIGEAARSSHHDICVISAGSNDALNLNLRKNLEAIRNNTKCRIVVWVKPANSRASGVVAGVASEHGDRQVQVNPGRDHIHPHSYPQLASEIKAAIGR